MTLQPTNQAVPVYNGKGDALKQSRFYTNGQLRSSNNLLLNRVVYKHTNTVPLCDLMLSLMINPLLAYGALLQCLPSFPELWTSEA